MTPFRLRLLVLTFLGMATAISVNALYFQDAAIVASTVEPEETLPRADATRSETVSAAGLEPPSASSADTPVEIASSPKSAPSKIAKPTEIDAALESVAAIAKKETEPPAADSVEQPSPRLVRAIQRELGYRGYDPIPETGRADPETRAAIIAYEFDMGLPLTGKPTDGLLKTLLFEAPAALPPPGRRAQFEQAARLVAQVQSVLSRMGYGATAPHGRLDDETREAIRKFEADRNLSGGGRITARLLVEMVIVTGQSFAARG